MKLRIHASTLRLRLSQAEVATLRQVGKVEERCEFGDGGVFGYSVERCHATSVFAKMAPGGISFHIPDEVAMRWIDSDEVGVSGTGVLIEKDFQCLHRNSPEDADSFPNPAA